MRGTLSKLSKGTNHIRDQAARVKEVEEAGEVQEVKEKSGHS
jgi:hypothetical protein